MRLNIIILCSILLPLTGKSRSGTASAWQHYRQRVAVTVTQLMRNYAITYVYGGAQVYSAAACTTCVRCLAGEMGKTAMANCTVCASCSLDCSHFIHHVFNRAGLSMPYLTTQQMLQLSPQRLQRGWRLVTMPQQVRLIRPLDLLVYKGHVVMVETVNSKGRGTIVHVTAGRELRGPGAALQRERQVEFAHFRGPLRRILRHRNLIATP